MLRDRCGKGGWKREREGGGKAGRLYKKMSILDLFYTFVKSFILTTLLFVGLGLTN